MLATCRVGDGNRTLAAATSPTRSREHRGPEAISISAQMALGNRLSPCGIRLLAVRDERNCLDNQILAQVVALLRLLRRLDLMVVVDEVWVPLARVTTKEAVVTRGRFLTRPRLARRLVTGS